MWMRSSSTTAWLRLTPLASSSSMMRRGKRACVLTDKVLCAYLGSEIRVGISRGLETPCWPLRVQMCTRLTHACVFTDRVYRRILFHQVTPPHRLALVSIRPSSAFTGMNLRLRRLTMYCATTCEIRHVLFTCGRTGAALTGALYSHHLMMVMRLSCRRRTTGCIRCIRWPKENAHGELHQLCCRQLPRKIPQRRHHRVSLKIFLAPRCSSSRPC